MRTTLVALSVLVLVTTACGEDGGAGPSPSPTAISPSPPSSPAAPPAPTSPTPSPPPTQTADDVELALDTVAEGLDAPLLVTAPPGEDAIWVAEQRGTVLVLSPGGETRTFLDITDRVTSGGERGFLGLAFHPDYADNGRVFAHYSGSDGRTVLSEFSAAGEPATVDPATEQMLLTVPQPAPNHNGGTVTFGPDGRLYLALGDGGGGGDTFDNGQDTDTLLGTILRLDVSTRGEYAIPPDNPFADGEDGAPELFAYGLRNPYRIAFGPDGALYIADVGQDALEEVNALHYEQARGANFGWPVLEGSRCFRSADCDPSAYVLPVTEYTHEETAGCSVIGGQVYTGDAMPGLAGHYFYSDLCAGFLRSIRVEDGEVVDQRSWTEQVGGLGRVLSIGKDALGEVYITEQEGRVHRLVPAG